MVLCDTHIHLLAPQWQEPVPHRIAQARTCGIELLLQPGVGAADWEQLVALAADHPGVYAAPGLHPLCAEVWDDGVARRLRNLCALPQVVAIGEIGLDALLEVDLAVQERALRAQLEIAIEVGLPVLIHCRKQTGGVLQILKEVGIARIGGIWHGFSGSLETARQIVVLGLLIGVGPVLLRDTARRLPALVKALPAETLVLETDAPDMAVGPQVLLEVATRLAELRGWTLAETARITTANARRLLKV